MAEISPSGFFSKPPQRPAAPSPPPAPAGPPAKIRNTRSLVAVNALTIVMAIIFETPLRTLLLTYWIQSMVIGYYSHRRILELQHFSTEGVRFDDEPADPTEATKRALVREVVWPYFAFHAAYLLVLSLTLRGLTLYDWIGLGVGAVAFVWNHRASFQRNAAADRRGTPNIGTLAGLPWLRVLPMQFAIVVGGMADFQGVMPLLVFGSLKTGADVLMHSIEHRVLQTGSAGLTMGRSPREAEALRWSRPEAVRWFRQAVGRGDADAQFNLGRMLAQGDGAPQDFAEAVKWYRLAAEQGQPTAQHNLGLIYAQGQGVPQDFAEAVKWLNLAVSRLVPGSERDTALKNRDLIAQRMTPAHVLEAQRRAQEWKPKARPWWMLAGLGGRSKRDPDRGVRSDVEEREKAPKC